MIDLNRDANEEDGKARNNREDYETDKGGYLRLAAEGKPDEDDNKEDCKSDSAGKTVDEAYPTVPLDLALKRLSHDFQATESRD